MFSTSEHFLSCCADCVACLNLLQDRLKSRYRVYFSNKACRSFVRMIWGREMKKSFHEHFNPARRDPTLLGSFLLWTDEQSNSCGSPTRSAVTPISAHTIMYSPLSVCLWNQMNLASKSLVATEFLCSLKHLTSLHQALSDTSQYWIHHTLSGISYDLIHHVYREFQMNRSSTHSLGHITLMDPPCYLRHVI